MSDTPETIYLIPDTEHGHVWCDDPAPGIGMDPRDAIEYVCADEAKARIAELEEALEPFAKLSKWVPVYEMITVNDMRQALALLKDKST